jgi:hypothetical protein
MSTIKNYQEQVQDIIEKAIATVEEQHKALAATSFDYIEKLYKVETVKTKHNDVAEVAYNKAREVNKLVADYASDFIAKFDKEVAAPVKKAAKKAPAKKAAVKKAVAAKVEAVTA